MHRTLEPEILDTLAPTDPAAVHNRRDLRLTNAVMRNHAWYRRILPRLVHPGERILELGAGTAELAVDLGRRGLPVDGLDLWPQPPNWPVARAWHRMDLRRFDRWKDYPVVIGNLIFHQFSDLDLAALGTDAARHARLIVACEPTRRRFSQVAYRALAPLFGANYVTLHDAHVSIAAGFRGQELPRLLGLKPTEWEVRCSTTLLGAYRMIAVRTP